MSKNKSSIVRFWHKHPVFCNFLTIIVVAMIMVWLVGVVFLNYWTRHGDEIAMPQVKNLNVNDACHVLEDADFKVKLDSMYSDEVAPGTVIQQAPSENSMVKRGGTAYLMYVCFSTKKAKVPEFADGSAANAMSAFSNAGFKNLATKEVASEQNDLVLGATYNGLELKPGMEIPVNAHIVIEVGVNFNNDYTEEGVYQEDSDAEFLEELDLYNYDFE